MFVQLVPVHVILNSDTTAAKLSLSKYPVCESTVFEPDDLEFNEEFNTIGKQLNRFAAQGPEKLYQYLNHLWGKTLFDKEFTLFKYSLLIND